MSREKEHFRDMLMRLDERFPDKEVLRLKEVLQFTGIGDARTFKRVYKVKGPHISKVQLASLLS